jgi:hypothetical protein
MKNATQRLNGSVEKKFLMLVASGILGFGALPAWAGLTDGLVVHLTFDDCTGSDSSGYANNAQFHNSSCVDGVHGKAIKLSGLDLPGFGHIKNTASLVSSNFTYSTWLRIDKNHISTYGQPHLHTIFSREWEYSSILRLGDQTSVTIGGIDVYRGAGGMAKTPVALGA